MKAIILAAWVWSRLQPLTNTKPKPIIKIFWKTIIEHNLEHVYKEVDEIIIIIKHKGEEIKNYFWDTYKTTKITYITQWEYKWTAGALKEININDDFILLSWDNIFEKNDLEKIVNFNWYWILAQTVKNPQKYWILKIDMDWNIDSVIEKSNTYVWNLASLWVYKLNSKIFEYIKEVELSPRGEYELTDAINIYVKNHPLKVLEIKWKFIDITYPWDIFAANNYFLEKLTKSNIKWIIEERVTIKWNIVLEEWAVLKSWTYIEWNVYIWKDSVVWPNTYLRNGTVIWNNCRIWNGVELKECSLWDNTNVAHLTYVWNSILGNNVNIWGGTIFANLRHDKKNIRVPIKWVLTETWLRKLWCIIWDNTKIWINTSIYPWRVILNDSFSIPGEIIK